MNTYDKVKEMIQTMANNKFDSRTYREFWYKDLTTANLAFETFS